MQVCSSQCEKKTDGRHGSPYPIFFRPGALYTDLQQDNIKIQTTRSKPKFIFLFCFFVLALFLVLSKFCSKELVLNAFIRSKQIYTAKIFYARESVTTFPPGKLVSFWRKLATSRFRVFCSYGNFSPLDQRSPSIFYTNSTLDICKRDEWYHIGL